ncbi:MAG: HEAT repeat domain-containing protein [Cyanobacteriota bacterium]
MDYEELRQKELDKIIERIISEREFPVSQRLKSLDSLEITVAGSVSYILLEVLKTEVDPNVVIHISNILARTGDEEVVMPLVDIALGNREVHGGEDPLKENKQQYEKVRCAIIKSLGRLKDEKAVIPLMYMLNDRNENYKVRLNAAEALGRIGDTYAVNPLINLVADEKEDSIYVRESAARALGMLGDVRAIKPLVKILESKRGIFDKFTFLKERAIEAIAKLGGGSDRDAIKALKESLIDEAPSVRLSAVEAISSMGDSSLIPILIPMVYDEEEDVSRESVRAIYSLEGHLELEKLLKDDRLPGWSRDEIETVYNEEE